MLIGIPRERKTLEGRIALTPAAVADLIADGHRVRIEDDAGVGSGYHNSDYLAVGADVGNKPADIYASELVVKVKEPTAEEIMWLGKGQLLFCYLHLAAYPAVLHGLLQQQVTALAFETLTVDNRLPLLAPMSAVAGRLAVMLGMQYLQQTNGGAGILLGGVMNIGATGRVVVLGAGVAGSQAALLAAAIGAEVYVLDKSPAALANVSRHNLLLHAVLYDEQVLMSLLPTSDLVIGAVLIKGANAPHILTRQHQQLLGQGRIVIDIAIDQGGCVEGIQATDWRQPIYWRDGIGYIAVSNMPGAVPRTSTQALSQAILPYVRQLAAGRLKDSPELQSALAVDQGRIVHPALQEAAT